MKLSVQNRLVLWYVALFVAGMLVLAAAFFPLLQKQIELNSRQILLAEAIWLGQMTEKPGVALASWGEQVPEAARESLIRELRERYANKAQFAVISVKTESRASYFSSGVKNIQLFLPDDVYEKPITSARLELGMHSYRVNAQLRPWGAIVVGIEDRLFPAFLASFGQLMLWLIPVLLMVTAISGFIFARLVMAPVLKAARMADRLSIHHPGERLPEYSGQDAFGELTQTLNGMLDRLHAQVLQLRQFTHDAAHELKTPLTIMRGKLEAAYQETEMPDELSDTFNQVLDRVISLSAMVQDLLFLAEQESPGMILNKEPVSLDSVIGPLLEDAEFLLAGKPVRICAEYNKSLQAYGDRKLLQRALFNLLDNAIRYTKSGEINISAKLNHQHVLLQITDTGCGIPEAEQKHVLSRFYRSSESRGSDISGSGLGLAITQRIVDLHGGYLKLTSKPGAGTSVSIALPAADTAAA